MIVHELITKLGFDVDDKGLKQAEQGLQNIKKVAESMRNIGLQIFRSICFL